MDCRVGMVTEPVATCAVAVKSRISTTRHWANKTALPGGIGHGGAAGRWLTPAVSWPTMASHDSRTGSWHQTTEMVQEVMKIMEPQSDPRGVPPERSRRQFLPVSRQTSVQIRNRLIPSVNCRTLKLIRRPTGQPESLRYERICPSWIAVSSCTAFSSTITVCWTSRSIL